MNTLKKLLLKFLWLLLPFAAVFAVLEYGLPSVTNSYNKKHRQLLAQRDSIRTLILGSSHAIKGINPEVLRPGAYNLGNVSQSLFYDTHLALKYLDSLPQLETVIIPVSYGSLHIQLAQTSEYWRDEFYYRYWDIRFPSYQPGTERFSLTMLYTPKTALSIALHGFNRDLVPEINAYGFQLTDTVHHFYSEQTGRERIGFHHSIMKAENVPANTMYLDSLLGALNQRHIKAVLVTLPVYKTYAVHMKPAILISNNSILNTLAEKHHCLYLDYFKDPRFTDADFLDNDHLNIRGANKMAGILKEVIR